MKHNWNSIKNYLDRHESFLFDYTSQHADKIYTYSYTVLPDRLILTCIGIMFTTFTGKTIRCDITKVAIKDDQNSRMKTLKYSYNANIPGISNSTIFRFCSPDENKDFDPSNHHTYHHFHDFRSGKEIITEIPETDWPHVSEFFDMVLKL